jgi:hypothetical protein
MMNFWSDEVKLVARDQNPNELADFNPVSCQPNHGQNIINKIQNPKKTTGSHMHGFNRTLSRAEIEQ